MKAEDIRTLDDLAGRIGGALGLPDIFERRRTADLVAARTVFDYLACEGLGCTVMEVSRYTGWQYSIAYYHVKLFRQSLRYDWRLRFAWKQCAGIAASLGVG